jgi:hypothetical protein
MVISRDVKLGFNQSGSSDRVVIEDGNSPSTLRLYPNQPSAGFEGSLRQTVCANVIAHLAFLSSKN